MADDAMGAIPDEPGPEPGPPATGGFAGWSWRAMEAAIFGSADLPVGAEVAGTTHDPATLAATGLAYEQFRDEMTAARDQILDALTALTGTGGGWQGPAALAFTARTVGIVDRLDAALGSVSALPDGMRESARAFARTQAALLEIRRWAVGVYLAAGESLEGGRFFPERVPGLPEQIAAAQRPYLEALDERYRTVTEGVLPAVAPADAGTGARPPTGGAASPDAPGPTPTDVPTDSGVGGAAGAGAGDGGAGEGGAGGGIAVSTGAGEGGAGEGGAGEGGTGGGGAGAAGAAGGGAVDGGGADGGVAGGDGANGGAAGGGGAVDGGAPARPGPPGGGDGAFADAPAAGGDGVEPGRTAEGAAGGTGPGGAVIAPGPEAGTTAGAVPDGVAPAGGVPTGDVSIGAAPAGGTSIGGTPIGGTPIGAAPIGGTSIGGAPTDAASIGGAPTGGLSFGGVQTDGAPADGAPAGGGPGVDGRGAGGGQAGIEPAGTGPAGSGGSVGSSGVPTPGFAPFVAADLEPAGGGAPGAGGTPVGAGPAGGAALGVVPFAAPPTGGSTGGGPRGPARGGGGSGGSDGSDGSDAPRPTAPVPAFPGFSDATTLATTTPGGSVPAPSVLPGTGGAVPGVRGPAPRSRSRTRRPAPAGASQPSPPGGQDLPVEAGSGGVPEPPRPLLPTTGASETERDEPPIALVAIGDGPAVAAGGGPSPADLPPGVPADDDPLPARRAPADLPGFAPSADLLGALGSGPGGGEPAGPGIRAAGPVPAFGGPVLGAPPPWEAGAVPQPAPGPDPAAVRVPPVLGPADPGAVAPDAPRPPSFEPYDPGRAYSLEPSLLDAPAAPAGAPLPGGSSLGFTESVLGGAGGGDRAPAGSPGHLPMMPPMGGLGANDSAAGPGRETWLEEDRDVWGATVVLSGSVLGADVPVAAAPAPPPAVAPPVSPGPRPVRR